MQDWIFYIKHEDNKALSKIYTLFRNECTSWLINNYSLDPDSATEIFQNAVIVLYDNVITGKLKELTSSIKTYLFGIARNQAMVYKTNISRNSKIDLNDQILMIIEEDTENFVIENDLKTADLALEIIGEPCKSLLQLYYYKEMSMEEITILLGYKNADTTKNQKYKCMKRLQKAFKEYKEKIRSYE